MKIIKKQFKSVALILSMLILFQGCTAYKSASVTLDEASKSEGKVKVHTTTNETLKFKRIGIENGNYYGVKKIKGDLVKVPLDKTKLNKIKVKDDTMSTIMTIALPVVIIGAGLGVFAYYWYGGI